MLSTFFLVCLFSVHCVLQVDAQNFYLILHALYALHVLRALYVLHALHVHHALHALNALHVLYAVHIRCVLHVSVLYGSLVLLELHVLHVVAHWGCLALFVLLVLAELHVLQALHLAAQYCYRFHRVLSDFLAFHVLQHVVALRG